MNGQRPQAKSSQARLAAIERRRQCVELRLSGASVGAIAGKLGLSKSTVHKHLTKAMVEATEALDRPASEIKALELARLDRLLLAVWGNASKGDVQHVDRALKIMERRAKLLGLDAPLRLAHGGDRDAPPIRSEQAVHALTDDQLERIAAGGGT